MANKQNSDSENDFQIGLQTELSVLKFRKSKTGQEIIADILKQYEELVEKFRQSFEAAREESIRHAYIMSMGKHETAEPQAVEAAETAFLKNLHKSKDVKTPPPESPKRNSYDGMLKAYDSQIGALETHKINTEQEYNSFEDSFGKSDKFFATLDFDDKEGSKATLQDKIDELKAQYDQDSEKLMNDLDTGKISDAEAKAGLAKIRAQGLEITQLNEMLSVINDEKVMYKKDGTMATAFAEADFLVKKDQQLIKEGDNHYLLDKMDNQGNPIFLNESNREQAKQSFEHAQSGMINLKDLVKNNKSIDMNQIEEQLQEARAQRDLHVNENAPKPPEMMASPDTVVKASETLEANHLDLNVSADKPENTSDAELTRESKQQAGLQ